MTDYHNPGGPSRGTNLVDILDRVLDKGLVVAGDIRISLANVELLTIKIRLIVCSIDKAEQIGLNWWRYDENLVRSGPAESLPDAGAVARLEARIAELESQLAQSTRRGTPSTTSTQATKSTQRRKTRRS
ncbi:MAG: gas vesicle protein [Chloroflexota bacterium]